MREVLSEVTEPASAGSGSRLRVVILTHICWPEPADFKNLPLARELAGRGHSVTIVTGFPNYPLGKIYPGYRLAWRRWEQVDGVRILRVPLYPDHSSSGLRRMANYLSFTLSASILGPLLAGRTDVVFVYSPPMTLGITARLFKAFRRARVVLDVVDLWPDAVAGSGMASSRLVVAGSGWFARRSYRAADRITVLTEGFRERVLAQLGARPIPVTVRPPWAQDEVAGPDRAFAASFGLDGMFCVVHAGNLGVFQDIETVLAAADLLRDQPDVRLVLVGGGRDLAEIRAAVARRNLSNVVLTGLVPAERIPGVLARADACLVSLVSDPYLNINLPSKFASYLAAGRPIVANASGQVANVVRAERVGFAATPGRPAELADAIRRMRAMTPAERTAMSLRARRLFQRDYEARTGLAGYVRMIEGLAAARPVRRR
ncbi:glycosyltransferase family 4 protein [Plantactinospora sp. KBS50]|uniref:glycosyltransferase family 4 protein n=1 Tax=Plantactinospora sp. KBS50 TaxID=2024580 RepID=UPI0018DEFFD0|nr:glycosyltransferase family 4 protein [Plantactinospora sp. KBS50]